MIGARDAHGNVRIVGDGKEAVVCTMGEDPMAKDPRTAPKVPRYLAFDKGGVFVGYYATLTGAFNLGWGRTPADAKALADFVAAIQS